MPRILLTIALSICAIVTASVPREAHAALGDALRTITPTAATTVDGALIDPLCGSQGGTSMAVVQGSKLAGVNPATHSILLAISCLDNGGASSAIERRARINFIDVTNGKVIKAITTRINGVIAAPSNGWAHWVNRPDVGDLLACGNDGTVWSIDYSQFTSTTDGTAVPVPRPAGLAANCAALGWDGEEDTIYQGVTGSTGIGVHRFRNNTTTLLGTFPTPCAPKGVAVAGGVLLVACDGVTTIVRIDKTTGVALNTTLTPGGLLGVLGQAPGTKLSEALGDLACDPTTFASQYNDVFWSRNGLNGNRAAALKFPPFTCGMPSNATVLWPGLSTASGGQAGTAPRTACFTGLTTGLNGFDGTVVDSDKDGLPDCWEGTNGIDFNGDAVIDLTLCVPVNTNGDGTTMVNECATVGRKDIFVEIDYMAGRKPDPRALSQAAPVTVVTSVREMFKAAPVDPVGTGFQGIDIHLLVDDQVPFSEFLAFTPCTAPAPTGVADFDLLKFQFFGTAAQRAAGANTLNAKRLAFRYVIVGNKLHGTSASGCAEVSGDDAAITLGAFTNTVDQQAATLAHELGHTLGLRHGSHDNVNCKPNYRSIMSYTWQFIGSPIPGRRLDYSRFTDSTLDEKALNENLPLSPDMASLQNDQIAFGPTAWTVIPANTSPINWNRNKDRKGASIIESSSTANLNQGSGGCDGGGGRFASTAEPVMESRNDWANLQYRFTGALDFGTGVRPDGPSTEVDELTIERENELFLAADLDANGVPDALDCGLSGRLSSSAFPTTNGIVDLTSTAVPIGVNPTTRGFPASGTAVLVNMASDAVGGTDTFEYTGTNETSFTGVSGIDAPLTDQWPAGTRVERQLECLHRIDIKPSFAVPKVIKLGSEATVTIAIFSEKVGTEIWDAPSQVISNSLEFHIASLVLPVKINRTGGGTCSVQDAGAPTEGTKNGPKDGIKDLICQFPTSGIPLGTHLGAVLGKFLDPVTKEIRAFRARQVFTVVP